MSHFSLRHEFQTEPSDFWKVFFHEPFNEDVYRRVNVKERTVLYHREEGDVVSFSVRVVPARDLPGFLKKIVGGDLGYVETSTFDLSKNRGDVKIEPTLLRDRTTIQAIYRLDVLGGGRLARIFEGDIEIRMPLVGAKIERHVIEDLRKSYDLSAEVMAEWLKRPL